MTVTHASGPAEEISLHIDDSGETWLGKGSQTAAPITGARLAWKFRGAPQDTEIPFATVFHAEFQTTPKNPKAGEPVQLGFAIKDFFGRSVHTLQVEHEKQMHLMVVSRDLSDFWHIHPEVSAGNVFRVPHTFPSGGDYRLYADFTPIGAANRIQAFDLKVEGPPHAAVPLVSTKNEAIVDGMKMVLSTDKPLRVGDDIGFSMAVSDAATGAPVHNLQPYLGAWAHIAVISEDTQDFLHVHPTEQPGELSATAAHPGQSTPSTIRTATGFRRPGLYKMWVQIKRANKVTAMPFVFKVAPAGSSVTQISRAPAGSILINVSSAGFEPATIAAKAGQPMKLAFFRPDAANCARTVVFPSLGISRDLPPGQTTVVDLTPSRTGNLSFECGMKMLHGQLIVR
jgi:hypothetical protein